MCRNRPLIGLRRHLILLIPLLLCVWDTRSGFAADPQPYRIAIAPTGDAGIDRAAQDSSTLVSLHDTAPVGPFALVARARGDAERLNAVLGSYGHYAGRVVITIAGREIGDPDLPEALDAIAAGVEVPVDVTLTPGPQFHLRRITVQGNLPAGARDTLGLAPGQPALATDVLAAQARLLAYLRDTGHAFAKVEAPAATLEPAAQALDVAFQVTAGPRVQIGRISVSGLEDVSESYVRRRLLLRPGEEYNPDRMEKARQDLAAQGVFSSVRMTPADHLGPDGALPVEVTVTERPARVVELNASFSTDLGVTAGASWTHRNLFGNAEQLKLSAAATGLGGTAIDQPGYNVAAQLTFPDWLQRDQNLIFNLGGVRESLVAYDRTALLAGVTVTRKITEYLSANIGLAGEQARIKQEGVTRDYTLAQLPLGVTYDNTGSLFDPTHGFKAAAIVTPSQSLLRPTSTFLIAQASASAYFDLAAPGRSVLAIRGLVGSISGASTFEVPPDQRFYGGGGGTVRGFRYQSIGPRFPDQRPVGGTSIDAGTVEFRQRFGESYGAVVFVDAGQVGSDGVPFTGALRVGAGVGARYYTGIGPIRFDVAVPLNKQRKDDVLEVYIGIGQAF